MNRLIVTAIVLGMSVSCAYAADDLLPDDATLYIERTTRPNPLMQEVDPSYAFHAKNARKRLERALYYLLLARQEYKLHTNHLRTLEIQAPQKNADAIDEVIIMLDNELNPPTDTNPLATVVTNLPQVTISVDPTTRSVITSEPRNPYDGLEDMFDGLGSPASRIGATSAPAKKEYAPVVSPTIRQPQPTQKTTPSPSQVGGASAFNLPSMFNVQDTNKTLTIPAYEPRKTTPQGTCATCTDTGVNITN